MAGAPAGPDLHADRGGNQTIVARATEVGGPWQAESPEHTRRRALAVLVGTKVVGGVQHLTKVFAHTALPPHPTHTPPTVQEATTNGWLPKLVAARRGRKFSRLSMRRVSSCEARPARHGAHACRAQPAVTPAKGQGGTIRQSVQLRALRRASEQTGQDRQQWASCQGTQRRPRSVTITVKGRYGKRSPRHHAVSPGRTGPFSDRRAFCHKGLALAQAQGTYGRQGAGTCWAAGLQEHSRPMQSARGHMI